MQSPIERLGVESDLRTAIIEGLAVQGITLASPSQDLILHRGTPAVQVAQATASANAFPASLVVDR